MATLGLKEMGKLVKVGKREEQGQRQNSKCYFVILPQILFFQNIKIKLKTRTMMTLKSLLVIFQALKPLQPQ